jgi:hypothetical protein
MRTADQRGGRTSRPLPLYQIPWQEAFAGYPPMSAGHVRQTDLSLTSTIWRLSHFADRVLQRPYCEQATPGRPVADFRLFGRQLAMFTRFMT